MSRPLKAVLVAAIAAGCADAGPTQPDTLLVPVFSHGAGTPHGAELHFKTHLTGDEEVPSNPSRAQGQAIFRLSEDGTSMDYKLIVANIRDVTQAHIHLGQSGRNGGIVVWLYPQCPRPTSCSAQLIPDRTQGVLDEGTLTVADVRGTFLLGQPDPFAALLARIRIDSAYVNVHTIPLPGGEVRGQLPN
jgi:hypothetical protein